MPSDENPEGGNSKFVVNIKDLAADLSALDKTAKANSEANGSHRNQLKQILEQRGYHPKALAVIRSIDSMSETKRADVLRTFVPMFNALFEGKWSAEMEDMFSDGDSGGLKGA